MAGRRKRWRRLSPGRNIPVRTFADWNRPPPEFLEIELVARGGDSMWGSFVSSLVATDICTGWRKVQQWQGIMANKLVYAPSEATLPGPAGMTEMALAAGDPKR